MSAQDHTNTSGKRIAIIGMACLYPDAPTLIDFWSNIVRGRDSIRDVTEKEWDQQKYFDPNATAFGKTYCKRGGFITEHAEFDPLQFGVMPNMVAGTDPDQLLALRIANEALSDAGYLDRPFDGERAEVILGRISAPGAGSMNLIDQSKTVTDIAEILKSVLPDGNDELVNGIVSQLRTRLQPCTSNNIPGVMPNVLAGRIAAKLGFRGRNLLVDAACASSMVALEIAVQDLLNGSCDFALAGGVYANSSAAMFNLFCGLGALSRSETIRPFDDNADGTLLGEGLGMVCLKRLADAVRDGDKIYATIAGIGSSSDGYGGSAIAPSVSGEALAMQRAFEMAGVSARSVELLEAHGTGTPTGDVAELQAVEKVFGEAGGIDQQWCAVGSVKSMIGHCQSASAIAGVIKTALALYHKVLPPTLNVNSPNQKINWQKHPCYVNSQARPWLKNPSFNSQPRRAAVSAFGFGGINGHAILEEHDEGDKLQEQTLHHRWESELFVLAAADTHQLQENITSVIRYITDHPHTSLKDLAFTLAGMTAPKHAEALGLSAYRLAVIATSNTDLAGKLHLFETTLRSNTEQGIIFTAPGTRITGTLGFLYPGLGSAYTNMLGDLAIHFPEVRRVFEIVDEVARRAGSPVRPSDVIFPKEKSADKQSEDLSTADFAVVAVLLAEYALFELLRQLEIKPDALMGCSTGEFAAITTGGAVDVLSAAELFYRQSTAVGRNLPDQEENQLVSMRVLAARSTVEPLIESKDIHLAADLGPEHVILTGSIAAMKTVADELRERRAPVQSLPTPIVYHTPFVNSLLDGNNRDVARVEVKKLDLPVWSCSRAAVYPNDEGELRRSFTNLFTKSISLRETVEGMYRAGIRHFVEVGPNGVLTALVKDILHDRPHVAVATNLAARTGLRQLQQMLATLFCHGVDMNFDYLYKRRQPRKLDLQKQAGSAPARKLIDVEHRALFVKPEQLPFVQNGERIQTQDIVEEDASADACGSAASEETIVGNFLRTNAEFFQKLNRAQEQIMTAYLDSAGSSITESGAIDDYAFLREAQIDMQEKTTTLSVPVHLSDHQYLLDHAIGGNVATEPNQRLYLLPLMVAIEMMAEAACAHIGDLVAVRIEQVKAFRRIIIDRSSITLTLSARDTNDARRITVALYQPDDAQEPSMTCQVVFAENYPVAPRNNEAINNAARPKRLVDALHLYSENAMFHGPTMQSVASIDAVGERRLQGRVNARIADGWLSNTQTPRFIADPLLLDNASQLVLFYLYENGLPATALLPFFIDSIELFTQLDALNQTVTGVASLTSLSDRATEAQVSVSSPDGALIVRINNIHSRRIILDETWTKFVRQPGSIRLCESLDLERWDSAENRYNGVDSTTVRNRCTVSITSENVLPKDETVMDWCSDYVLTHKERRDFREIGKSAKRRQEWLLGRIAAKDAVRECVRKTYGLALAPHDILISTDEAGAPLVLFPHRQDLPAFFVSISHAAGTAVAVCTAAEEGRPGIDLERPEQRDSGFEQLWLHEAQSLGPVPADTEEKSLLLTKLWCAKEAAFKALAGNCPANTIKVVKHEILDNGERVLLTTPAGPLVVTLARHEFLVLALTQASLPALLPS